jgi:hypothetical protein
VNDRLKLKTLRTPRSRYALYRAPKGRYRCRMRWLSNQESRRASPTAQLRRVVARGPTWPLVWTPAVTWGDLQLQPLAKLGPHNRGYPPSGTAENRAEPAATAFCLGLCCPFLDHLVVCVSSVLLSPGYYSSQQLFSRSAIPPIMGLGI